MRSTYFSFTISLCQLTLLTKEIKLTYYSILHPLHGRKYLCTTEQKKQINLQSTIFNHGALYFNTTLFTPVAIFSKSLLWLPCKLKSLRPPCKLIKMKVRPWCLSKQSKDRLKDATWPSFPGSVQFIVSFCYMRSTPTLKWASPLEKFIDIIYIILGFDDVRVNLKASIVVDVFSFNKSEMHSHSSYQYIWNGVK